MSHRHRLTQAIEAGPLGQSDLELLSDEIAASLKPTVVVFIDLTDSTLMKYLEPAEEWIGAVFEFIKRCDFLARQKNGTVIKHIGDEAMITFDSIDAAENFLEAMLQDESLSRYRFKTAVDFGEAYFLHSHHEDDLPAKYCPWPAPQDPYGKVVDRCARIAATAPTGSILCSEDYRNAHHGGDGFPLAGTRMLKGIHEPCRLYFRHAPAGVTALDPLPPPPTA